MVVLETKSNKLYHCNLINEKILSFMYLETDTVNANKRRHYRTA